ncbi:MAG: hypothetical protein Q9213_005062 [Squamulea squamosa]
MELALIESGTSENSFDGLLHSTSKEYSWKSAMNAGSLMVKSLGSAGHKQAGSELDELRKSGEVLVGVERVKVGFLNRKLELGAAS